ncbi:MAG: hypothetical protein ACLRY7_12095 [Hominenteromicrobium sp.]
MKKRILLGLISVFKALYNAVYAVMKLRPMQKKSCHDQPPVEQPAAGF